MEVERDLSAQQLIETYQQGDVLMAFTWEDFEHWYIKDHFLRLTPEEQRQALERLSPEQRQGLLAQTLEHLPPDRRRELLKALPPEERLVGLTAEQVRQYLERLTAHRPPRPRKARRKK